MYADAQAAAVQRRAAERRRAGRAAPPKALPHFSTVPVRLPVQERSNNLYVKNLPITWDVVRLQEFFGMCGQVTECRILPISGVAPGASALVRMSAVEEAAATIEQVHGKIPPGERDPPRGHARDGAVLPVLLVV
ncbi:unnamed protein product [Pedinophyceae sp. YPF-701]|nr:unnamed protein product [Pedinophyceae sp. YPF-701]